MCVQGVRRMVALTGDAAREAQAEAQVLHKQLANAENLNADALGAELGSLRQVCILVQAALRFDLLSALVQQCAPVDTWACEKDACWDSGPTPSACTAVLCLC